MVEKIIKKLTLGAVFFVLWSGLAATNKVFAEEASLELSSNPKERVKYFNLAEPTTEVTEEGGQSYIYLRGNLDKEGWGLFSRGRWLVRPSSEDRSFSLKVPLEGDRTEIPLKVVNAKRKVRTIKIFASASGVKSKVSRDDKINAEAKDLEFILLLGLTNVKYQESGVPDFTMTGLTGKGVALFHLEKKWDLIFNGFLTLLSLKASRTDLSVRFFGLNAKVGYKLIDSEPFSFSIQPGLYYASMVVSENQFGFKNMMGPSFTGAIQYDLNARDSLTSYLKLGFISGLTFSDRELAVGAGYSHLLENGHRIYGALDYSVLDFLVKTSQIKSASFSLSLGYGF